MTRKADRQPDRPAKAEAWPGWINAMIEAIPTGRGKPSPVYGMSPRVFFIWAILARHAAESGIAWPSIATIEEITGMGRRTIFDVLNEGDGVAWKRVERGGGNHWNATNKYQLLMPKPKQNRPVKKSARVKNSAPVPVDDIPTLPRVKNSALDGCRNLHSTGEEFCTQNELSERTQGTNPFAADGAAARGIASQGGQTQTQPTSEPDAADDDQQSPDLDPEVLKRFAAQIDAMDAEFTPPVAETPTPPPPKYPPHPPRAATALRDDIVNRWFGGNVAKPDESRVGKLLRGFQAHGATPEEIPARVERYRARFPSAAATPEALLKHWAALAPPGVGNVDVDAADRQAAERAARRAKVDAERKENDRRLAQLDALDDAQLAALKARAVAETPVALRAITAAADPRMARGLRLAMLRYLDAPEGSRTTPTAQPTLQARERADAQRAEKAKREKARAEEREADRWRRAWWRDMSDADREALRERLAIDTAVSSPAFCRRLPGLPITSPLIETECVLRYCPPRPPALVGATQ